MAFADLLVHEIEVRRRSGELDRFGQPVDINPSMTSDDDVVGTYACREYHRSGGLTNQERSHDVFEELRRVFVEADADIREDDVVVVRDPASSLVLIPAAKVKVKNVVYGRALVHHLEVDLQVQRGPQ